MECNLGLVGAGTVGGGFVKILRRQQEFFRQRLGFSLILKRVVDRNPAALSILPLDGVICTDNYEDIVNDPEIHVVIELIGGTTIAKTITLRALQAGKQVVTANKALLAEHGPEIFSVAEKNNASVFFEGAVGGGIPLIKSIRESLIGNNIISVKTIINGTCNYILTQMALKGASFSEMLKSAQQAGYAEADPELDISGGDSGHKISIIGSLLFGGYTAYDKLYIEGIQKITPQDMKYAFYLGYTIKLLGLIKYNTNGTVDIRVHPTMLSTKHVLSSVSDVYNAALIEGDVVGQILLYGKGAGEMPTASAVISDVVDAAKNIAANNPNREPMHYYTHHNPIPLSPISSINTRYYLRFSVIDKPKVLGAISMILGQHAISIASVVQQEQEVHDLVPVVILTHEAREDNVQKAIQEIETHDFIKQKTQIIRIEE